MIKSQFLPPKRGSRSGEDSLASSTHSLNIPDLETPRYEGAKIEDIRYGEERGLTYLIIIKLLKVKLKKGLPKICQCLDNISEIRSSLFFAIF